MKISMLLIITLGTAVAQAQGPTRPTPKDAILESQRQERDNLLLRKPIAGDETDATRIATLKQINDDFRELQIQNNKLMQAMNGPKPDYKSVESTVANLGGRASRLKQNLSLPKAEAGPGTKSTQKLENEEGIKLALKLLDETVLSFTTNPLFRAGNVVDVDLGRKASRDLDLIIELSKRLRKALPK